MTLTTTTADVKAQMNQYMLELLEVRDKLVELENRGVELPPIPDEYIARLEALEAILDKIEAGETPE